MIKLYKVLVNEKGEYVMSKQILRCGTSVGANKILEKLKMPLAKLTLFISCLSHKKNLMRHYP
ncbi:MAG: hypothetical protein RI557_08725 [Salibacter sp.]|nr:hypothetical protein [Salibacter sp.]MDR9488127.1 hypothetical protein [Salibacter sp.]